MLLQNCDHVVLYHSLLFVCKHDLLNRKKYDIASPVTKNQHEFADWTDVNKSF